MRMEYYCFEKSFPWLVLSNIACRASVIHLADIPVSFFLDSEGQHWAAKVSEALAVSFIELDESFAGKGCGSGNLQVVGSPCGFY